MAANRSATSVIPSGAGQPPASATSVPLRSTSTSSAAETTTSAARIVIADDALRERATVPRGSTPPRPAAAARSGAARARSRRFLASDHLLLVGHLVVDDVGPADPAIADVVPHLVVAGEHPAAVRERQQQRWSRRT